jgi:hypothetical protein
VKAPLFLVMEPDGLIVNIDEVVYVRALDENDLDPRTGELRSGIDKQAVTELRLRDSTLYVRESLESFADRIRRAVDVIGGAL